MHKFYLTSECTPVSQNIHTYTSLFEATLRAYDGLVNDASLKVESGVVTETLPAALEVGQDFKLKDVIDKLSDRKLKELAFTYFIKHPIERHLEDWEEQYSNVEEAEYQILIGGESYDIFYLAFVAINEGFGFTIPIHSDLEQDVLNFTATNTGSDLGLYNFYANLAANINAVKARIQDINARFQSIFEQLMELLDDPVYHERHFKKAFENLALDVQQAIFNKFNTAVQHDAINQPDNKIVRDVTPDNATYTVLELRVFSPDLRVYFNKTDGVIYLASIKLKSSSNQSKDIQKAHDILYNLIVTNK